MSLAMKNSKSHYMWLRILVVILLVLGVFFRFANLDKKIYWGDETATSMRISGYTWAETDPRLYNVPEIGIKDLQKYQHLTPEKGVSDTVSGLAKEEPQHPPLYYVMTRFWVQRFGNSVAVIRSLSALSSLLVLPCLYWLCQELFESSLPGWIAIALVAVSPFHILYAQEAREYSLWTVTTLLSSATLLRAMRLKSTVSWGIYAATVILGFYTFLLSVFVVIGHGVYVFTLEGFKLSKTAFAYLAAALTGFLFLTPWLFFVVSNSSQVNKTTSWSRTTSQAAGGLISHLTLPVKWVRNVSLLFLDLDKGGRVVDLGFNNAFAYLIQIGLMGIITALAVYSIYFLCRNAPKRTWLFVLTLIGATSLGLILPDLASGGVLSAINRYTIPCFLGIQVAVAYLLATQISGISTNQHQTIWRFVAVTLVTSGVISCVAIAQANTWWNQSDTYTDSQVARIVNQAKHPLLICGSSQASSRAMSLSYLLNPKVRLQLITEPNMPKIPSNFSDIFLFRPSEVLLSRLKEEQNYRTKSIYEYTEVWLGQKKSKILLWRLEK